MLGSTEAKATEQSGQVEGEFYGLVKDFLGDVNHLQDRSGDALKKLPTCIRSWWPGRKPVSRWTY